MMSIHEVVIDRLRLLRRAPRTFAYTQESLAAQVALLLDLIEIDSRDFMQQIFKTPGTCEVDISKLSTEVDDEWARALIDEVAAVASLDLGLA